MAQAYVEIVVGGYHPRHVLTEVEIRQYNYQHDLALVYMRGTPIEVQTYRRGTPVQIAWGYPPNDYEHFYGYLNARREKHTAYTQDAMTVLQIVGASWPMKGQTQRAWSNVSDSYIAKAVALQYGLEAVVDPSPLIPAQIVQSNESDWAFLVRRAKAIGYHFFVTRTTLYFIDPLRWVVPERARLISGDSHPKLFSFDPDTGANPSNAQFASRSVRGVNEVTNEVVAATSNPSLDTQFSPESLEPPFHVFDDMPVDSTDFARVSVTGSEMSNRLWITAKGASEGIPNLASTRVLDVNVPGENGGLWLVTGVKHRLTGLQDIGGARGEYRTSFDCGRDKVHTASLAQIPPARVFEVNTTLRDNVWTAKEGVMPV